MALCVPSQNGLLARAAAAAERRPVALPDRLARARDDLEVAADEERAVRDRGHLELAPARLDAGAALIYGLAGGLEAGGDVAAVAVGLVLGGAAAAERGADLGGVALDLDRRVYGDRAVLAHTGEVDGRRLLRGAAVEALVADRARGARAREGGDLLGRGGVGVDPRAGRVGDEDVGPAEHAVAGVDAPRALEPDQDVLAADLARAVAHAHLRAGGYAKVGLQRSARRHHWQRCAVYVPSTLP